MLTVIIECLDQEAELAQTLAVLVSGAVEGIICDVVVLDRGSRDGTSRLADAAGCRFHGQWDLGDIVRTARGEWLLLVEPGARPASGWIDEIADYVTHSTAPAQFSPSRHHRLPFYRRFGRRSVPLEGGLLLSKRQASAIVQSGMRLGDLCKGLRMKSLSAELVPARVARQARSGLTE